MLKGVVKFFKSEQGYGFIAGDSADLFFHIRDFRGESDPVRGQRVTFDARETDRGLRAYNVEPLEG